MMRIFYVLLIVVLSLSMSAGAEEFPAIKDFAYGYQLDADGSMPVYRILLPEEVYSVTTRKDLGDVRVFNNQGETVPHVIKRPFSMKREPVHSVLLPYFPLYGPEIRTDRHSLRIATDYKGTIITVRDNRVDKTSSVTGYIIDTSMLLFPAENLQLKWEKGNKSFITTVSVSYSNDLTVWYPLNPRATLARLMFNNHVLGSSVIPLPLKKSKYLKLTWPTGKDGARLTSVEAKYSDKLAEQEINWKELGTSVTHNEPVAYEYDTGSNVTVGKLNVRFPYKNIIVNTVVLSRPQQESQWRERFRGLIYTLEIDGITLSSNPITISQTTDRYWLLKMISIEGELKETPQLLVGWIPQELVFIAQGDSPYLLAFGSAQVHPPLQSASSFFASIKEDETDSYVALDGQKHIVYEQDGVGKSVSRHLPKNKEKRVPIQTAGVGKRIELSGDSMLKPARKLPWKSWILWAIMLSGLCVLGNMVWRLNRQMQEASKNNTDSSS